jgi:hypothetical protein
MATHSRVIVDDIQRPKCAAVRERVERKVHRPPLTAPCLRRQPTKEREVQNAVEQLLIGRGLVKGIDYDRETGRVKVSIKECVPDFILPKLGLALEVKLATTDTKARAIVDEINADIQAYSRAYERSLFVVYDIGTIRDTFEFVRGLEASPGSEVIVVKH